MMIANKIIIFGIDGASIEVIKKWSKEGRLPNFKMIIERGISGIIRSTLPPLSCPAWPCLYSGIKNKKIDVYDFKKFYPKTKSYSLFNRSMNPYPFFWENISKRFFGFHIAYTYPPKESDQNIVCGVSGTTNESHFTYPESIKKEVFKVCNFRFHNINEYDSDNLNIRQKEGFRTLYQDIKLYRYFLTKKKWDIFMVTFEVSDRIQHYFWKFMNKKGEFGDTILKIYDEFDKVIGWTLKKVKDVNLIIVSDHGYGEYNGKIYINDYLIEDNLLKLNAKEKRDIFYYLSKFGITGRNLEKLASIVKINRLLGQVLPRKLIYKFKVEKNKKAFEEAIIKGLIDWNKTIAYAPTGNTIYINRDCIKKNNISYKEAVNRIIKILKKAFDKDINNHIEINSTSDNKPDIVFDSHHYGYECSDYITGGIKKEFREKDIKTGTHRKEGAILAFGPDVRKGHIQADITDIAPTILHMLNEDIPKHMDGKILMDIFKEKSDLVIKET